MSNEILDDLSFDEETKAPNSLKVLTTLTFIGSALSFAFISYSLYSTLKIVDIETLGFWGLLTLTLALLADVLCVIGAAMMLGLNKNGFYIHAIGNIIAIGIGLFGLYSIIESANLYGINPYTPQTFGVLISIFLSLLFIYQYSKHRKYFTK